MHFVNFEGIAIDFPNQELASKSTAGLRVLDIRPETITNGPNPLVTVSES